MEIKFKQDVIEKAVAYYLKETGLKGNIQSIEFIKQRQKKSTSDSDEKSEPEFCALVEISDNLEITGNNTLASNSIFNKSDSSSDDST